MRGRAPELDAADARQLLGRSLARVHQIGALRSFRLRPRIGLQRLGIDACHQVLASDLLPQVLRDRYIDTSEALLGRVEQAFEQAGPIREIRIHGD
jgi:Ser/Thr protein kinase RdoA (MazF antagonist)